MHKVGSSRADIMRHFINNVSHLCIHGCTVCVEATTRRERTSEDSSSSQLTESSLLTSSHEQFFST